MWKKCGRRVASAISIDSQSCLRPSDRRLEIDGDVSQNFNGNSSSICEYYDMIVTEIAEPVRRDGGVPPRANSGLARLPRAAVAVTGDGACYHGFGYRCCL